jgi:hypothetical protein
MSVAILDPVLAAQTNRKELSRLEKTRGGPGNRLARYVREDERLLRFHPQLTRTAW